MLANLTVALPEDLATRAEKYASAHGMTLEELLLSLCKTEDALLQASAVGAGSICAGENAGEQDKEGGAE